jgi:hypothetical protein
MELINDYFINLLFNLSLYLFLFEFLIIFNFFIQIIYSKKSILLFMNTYDYLTF